MCSDLEYFKGFAVAATLNLHRNQSFRHGGPSS